MSEELNALINSEISNEDLKKKFYPNLAPINFDRTNLQLFNTFNSYFNAKDINEREKLYLNDVFTNKSYLGILFSAYLNLDHANLSGASFYLKKLTNISPRFLVLDIQDLVELSKRVSLKESILKILNKIWDSNLNEHLKNLFFESLVVLDDVEIRELQTGFLGDFLKSKSNFSLSDYKYSISYANFWISRINEDNTKFDLSHKFFNSPAFYDIEFAEYEIFSYATPSDKKRREYVFSSLKNKWDNLEHYEKEAILSALDNPVFRKELISIDGRFKLPLFNLKKDEHKKNVEQGRYQVYSIFKLLELGLEDEQMLGYLL